MKALLAFLVTFSVFANDHFVVQKEETLKRLRADTSVASTVVACVEGSKTMEEMTACEGHPTKHAKAIYHKGSKTKGI